MADTYIPVPYNVKLGDIIVLENLTKNVVYTFSFDERFIEFLPFINAELACGKNSRLKLHRVAYPGTKDSALYMKRPQEDIDYRKNTHDKHTYMLIDHVPAITKKLKNSLRKNTIDMMVDAGVLSAA